MLSSQHISSSFFVLSPFFLLCYFLLYFALLFFIFLLGVIQLSGRKKLHLKLVQVYAKIKASSRKMPKS